MARTKKTSKISTINWMGTLLLCAIPGVNIIAIICFLIFAKSPSKRSFALASLLWILILIAAAAVMLILLPTQVAEFSETLRDLAAKVPQATIAPLP